MRASSVRFNIAAVVAMTIAVMLLVLQHHAIGVALFALGAVLAVVAGRCAAVEAGRAGPIRLSGDAAAEEAEMRHDVPGGPPDPRT